MIKELLEGKSVRDVVLETLDDFPMKDISQINDKDEATQIAIDWQRWSSEQSLSYGELAEWSDYFSEIAKKFDLEEEFKENGVI